MTQEQLDKLAVERGETRKVLDDIDAQADLWGISRDELRVFVTERVNLAVYGGDPRRP